MVRKGIIMSNNKDSKSRINFSKNSEVAYFLWLKSGCPESIEEIAYFSMLQAGRPRGVDRAIWNETKHRLEANIREKMGLPKAELKQTKKTTVTKANNSVVTEVKNIDKNIVANKSTKKVKITKKNNVITTVSGMSSKINKKSKEKKVKVNVKNNKVTHKIVAPKKSVAIKNDKVALKAKSDVNKNVIPLKKVVKTKAQSLKSKSVKVNQPVSLKGTSKKQVSKAESSKVVNMPVNKINVKDEKITSKLAVNHK